MRFLFAFLLLVSSVAFSAAAVPASKAMTVTEEVTTGTNYINGDGYINAAECSNPSSDGLQFAWTLGDSSGNAPSPSSATLKLTVSTDTACSSAPPTAGTTWSQSITVSSASGQDPGSGYDSLSTILSALGISCATQQSLTMNTCASMTLNSVYYYASGQIIVDTRAAPTPSISDLVSHDGSLSVTITAVTSTGSTQSDSIKYALYAVPTGDPAPTAPYYSTALAPNSGETSRIVYSQSIENNTSYDVYGFAYSTAGNPSEPSKLLTGTPKPVDDFWRTYRNDGGVEEGGCASGPAGALALLLPLLALRRRRS